MDMEHQVDANHVVRGTPERDRHCMGERSGQANHRDGHQSGHAQVQAPVCSDWGQGDPNCGGSKTRPPGLRDIRAVATTPPSYGRSPRPAITVVTTGSSAIRSAAGRDDPPCELCRHPGCLYRSSWIVAATAMATLAAPRHAGSLVNSTARDCGAVATVAACLQSSAGSRHGRANRMDRASEKG